jgi:hypothetical protein
LISVNYEPGNTVSSFLNLRVANIQDCGAEIRCYMRDPDGYLIEVGQATGLLEG